MKPKIGVISAVPNATELYGNTPLSKECDLYFRIGYLDKALDLTRKLQNEVKLDAIITVGIPMEIYESIESVPIYPIFPSSFDILDALYAAHTLGEKLAFAEMRLKTIRYDLGHIIEILGYDVSCYQFHTNIALSHRENVERLVRKIIREGREVMVTMGGYSHQYAREQGFPSLLVAPGEQSFQMTLENVIRTFLSSHVESEKVRWMSAVFDNFREGVLVLDHDNRVVVLNSAAQQFMRLDQNEIAGKKFDSIKSPNPLFRKFFITHGNFEVIRGNTKDYIVKREILYDGKVPLGTVISAHPAKDLQKMELDARRKLYETGFVAHSTFSDIAGCGAAFEALKQKARSYAKSKSNVIIYGESGSGKELFAQSIHNASTYVEGPFVAINCTVLPENLLESELFGYEDGAFTGARKGGKMGLFEIAHKGTLFLDEIGDMPLGIQVKLLRVLQERTVRRIGGEKNIPVDVRFIFATNRDLRRDIQSGMFRTDLYYRINVLSLQIPPLRAHREDLKEISQDLIQRLSTQSGKTIPLTDEILRLLMRYDWPGNIRELGNFWERAMFFETVDAAAIRGMLRELEPIDGITAAAVIDETDTLSIELDTMRNMEDAIIKVLYEKFGGSRKKLANLLDISPSSLYRRLKELDGISGGS